MPALASQMLSRDLEHVAEHVAERASLDPNFCDRLTESLARLWTIGGAGFSPDDRERFDAIMIRVAPAAPLTARAALSDRIATDSAPPRRILLVLAHDVVDVSGVILRSSPALSEDDLMEIARTCGTGHMEAIAERTQLPMRLTDVLVLRGDDVVRRIVAGNHGARISDKSFSRLSLQARDDDYVEGFLVHRLDLPNVVVDFLEKNGSQTARAALAERRRNAPPPAARPSTSIRAAEDGWLEPYDFEAAEAVLQRLKAVRHQLDPFVRRLAQADHFAELVHVVATIAELPLDTVKHAMVSLSTDAFAMIARAIGLKADTVREILMVGPWLHRLDARAREATLLAFQAMGVDEARNRLRRWAAEQV